MAFSISESITRKDSEEKAGGYTKYVADITMEGMLYARILTSTKPRALIKSIFIPEISSDYTIVTDKDIPGKNRIKMISDDWPFLAEESVNYIGQPILVVAGPDKKEIALILSKIKVEYEEIKPCFTISESEKSDIPIINNNNLFADYSFTKGNPENAFINAARTFEHSYSTGLQEHIYLETQGMIADYNDNKITVYGSMQCPYYIKNALIQGFGWENDKIQVVQTTTGGAFGGKEDYPSLLAGLAAFTAYKTGKPVKIILDRDEDIRITTKRHPAKITIKTALDDNDRITGMYFDIKIDGGAYEGMSAVVLQRAMFAAAGVYNIDNVKVSGRAFATNNVPRGAFRGFGSPQAFFAIETHMHNLSIELGFNPLDFKISYFLKKGDPTITGGILYNNIKLNEMVKTIDRASSYTKKYREYHGKKTNRGIGISVFNHGCAFTGSGEKDKIKAKVKLRKDKNGKVYIHVSSVEMGQGAQTALSKIVAQTLNIDIENVVYDNPDTDIVPDSGPTVASRTTMIVGYLLHLAAKELKPGLNETGETEIVKQYSQPPKIQWDQDSFSGNAYPVFSWGVNVVEVDVDPVTFELNIIGIWGVYDVGTPIDKRMLKGQIDGGMVQGLGWAYLEVMEEDHGKLLQSTITDYIIPCSKDFPSIFCEFVENPYKYGPFGAKGAGELPHSGVAPALASAVENALSIPVNRIPITPEYLEAQIQ